MEIARKITYVMAPEDSFYSGHVMRRVTADVGSGRKSVLSETTTGMELDEFQQKYPNESVDGIKGSTLRNEISYMSDAELAALGLKRVDGDVTERPKPQKEVLEPTHTYPVHEGYGWYRLSNGNKAKGKVEATRRQELIDEGTPDPYDKEPKEEAPEETPEETDEE